ncbi:hypothetical protein A3A71_00355 [Candidatus Berkelbacteria bacterium RIFCSPLOWO2_01_FULL_50_28]|uniref:Uncharacterized protein n=1 Tax=Candidatus Berkelbacteria bacterium RIFCSPLOWO2_01_FULL_50_28 TaxID=1797471 RepID=A0A1F5EAR8_9BACT|nr:MAG: hypothetical protein A2807_01110 [Candidatus Berkelbacteria bacterium RIFCSPHIGHO2_01_FULL_50_36]OGD63552.1 MAG: hypothetical protein A3F39_02505 [Candidatus Berkelbacteria bacterium RIFCSPHIGHO2_12_FULL_50_11]OGD64499.1 MAG: hypothetical protein A3A71_00355 [Candidatus Berkelbacteria bacterium RIFCSPLOWO2_01_FULL_50_28]
MKNTHWLGLGCFIIAAIAGAMIIEPVGNYFLVDPLAAATVSGVFALVGLITGLVSHTKTSEQKYVSWLIIIGSVTFLSLVLYLWLSIRSSF